MVEEKVKIEKWFIRECKFLLFDIQICFESLNTLRDQSNDFAKKARNGNEFGVFLTDIYFGLSPFLTFANKLGRRRKLIRNFIFANKLIDDQDLGTFSKIEQQIKNGEDFLKDLRNVSEHESIEHNVKISQYIEDNKLKTNIILANKKGKEIFIEKFIQDTFFAFNNYARTLFSLLSKKGIEIQISYSKKIAERIKKTLESFSK